VESDGAVLLDSEPDEPEDLPVEGLEAQELLLP
jgi:hypothetical protein